MDGQLKAGTFLSSESSTKYKVVSLLGAGGQGEVYDVESNGKHYALKWYFKHMATREQKAILDNLVAKGSPDASFLWPQDLIFKSYGEPFGYIMPLRPKNFKSIVLDKNYSYLHQEIEITDEAVKEIINGYTMEAGVRNLEREIGGVVRKVAVKFAEHPRLKKQVVTAADVPIFLGVRKRIEEDVTGGEVGACTGLAWTAVGGTTLTIEAALMHGKGEILLTGKLGDVMKESARAAISYIRANANKYGIDSARFESTDIHIHVPEGATPKDGPSAGITMATAILSAFTGKPVKKGVAMTGEITLRGKVLAIGGLKEKTLAAFRKGIKTVVIPRANEKDLAEIPEEVKKEIIFVPVTDADEVFSVAIGL